MGLPGMWVFEEVVEVMACARVEGTDQVVCTYRKITHMHAHTHTRTHTHTHTHTHMYKYYVDHIIGVMHYPYTCSRKFQGVQVFTFLENAISFMKLKH